MDSAGSVGSQLRTLRQTRRLSLGQLERKAGVSKATLSRWEADATVPRIPEMLRVLESLDTTARQRATLLQLLEVPRAIRAERLGSEMSRRLSLGNLLFGLRQRAGLSQEEVARRILVSRSLYAQWEGDLCRPDSAQIHAVGFALGIAAEELAALCANDLAQRPMERSREAVMACYMESLSWNLGKGAYRLHLLAMLAAFSTLYREGKTDIGDIALVVNAFGEFAEQYSTVSDESERLFRSALRLAALTNQPLHFHLISSVVNLLKKSRLPVQERIVATVAWKDRFATPEGKAFLLACIASELAPIAPDDALRMGDRYLALVAHNADEYPCRQRDYGNLLRQCGRPAEAITYLSNLTPQDELRAGLLQLNIATAQKEMGDRQEALSSCARAKKILTEFGYRPAEPVISSLENALM